MVEGRSIPINKQIVITGTSNFMESRMKMGVENPRPWYSNHIGEKFLAEYDCGDMVAIGLSCHEFVSKGDFREI